MIASIRRFYKRHPLEVMASAMILFLSAILIIDQCAK